jgi:hypothetical protein
MKTKAKRKSHRRDSNVYPPGWDHAKVESVIKYYDARRDQDVLGQVEVSRVKPDLVWIEVPRQLVPQVAKLVNRYRRTA